jgi:small-conductance mechanosensitive channel
MWIQLKSDVANGVHRALAEAGIDIPFPQRDLHLHGLDWPVTPKDDCGASAAAGGS